MNWIQTKLKDGTKYTYLNADFGLGSGYAHLDQGFLPEGCRKPSLSETDARSRVISQLKRMLKDKVDDVNHIFYKLKNEVVYDIHKNR